MTPEERAALLVASIDCALAHGVKHYTVDGRELKTTQEVIDALQKDKRIVFEPPTKKQIERN